MEIDKYIRKNIDISLEEEALLRSLPRFTGLIPLRKAESIKNTKGDIIPKRTKQAEKAINSAKKNIKNKLAETKNQLESQIPKESNKDFYDLLDKLHDNDTKLALREINSLSKKYQGDILLRELENSANIKNIITTIYDLAKKGLNSERIRRLLNIKPVVWNSMMKSDNSPYSYAFDVGRDMLIADLTTNLAKASTEHTVKEHKVVYKYGEVFTEEVKERVIPINMEAVKMLAYNKSDGEFTPPAQIHIDNSTTNDTVINVDTLSPEAIDMLLAEAEENAKTHVIEGEIVE